MSEAKNNKVEHAYTPSPLPLFSGSYIDSSVLCHEIYMKYKLGVPYYRSYETRLKAGVDITPNELYQWTIKFYEQKVILLLPLIWDALLDNPEHIVQADETPHLVLRVPNKDPGSKSYVWSYNTCKCSKHPIHIYEYEEGRSGDFPAQKLLDFIGYLCSDAYQGYNKAVKATTIDNVVKIFRVLCWIHARRKFVEALPNDALLAVKSKAFEAVTKIDKIFEFEKQFDQLSADERKAKREEFIRPVVNELFAWFDEIEKRISGKSKMAEAIQYCRNGKDELLRFFEDGNLPVHNMVSEVSMRAVAIGRKNFNFYGSPRGAKAGCAMYTIVETAEANGLDSELYLKYLMDHMRTNKFDKSEQYLMTLLPWAEGPQSECRAKRQAAPNRKQVI